MLAPLRGDGLRTVTSLAGGALAITYNGAAPEKSGKATARARVREPAGISFPAPTIRIATVQRQVGSPEERQTRRGSRIVDHGQAGPSTVLPSSRPREEAPLVLTFASGWEVFAVPSRPDLTTPARGSLRSVRHQRTQIPTGRS
jgi:hypothetical protein